MKEGKDHSMLTGVYRYNLNFLLKKLNNLKSTNTEDFSREGTLTGFLQYHLIPLLSFPFGTVICKSPILQWLLSVVYVCKGWVWRGIHRYAGKNTDLFPGRIVQDLIFSPNACRHCFTHALEKMRRVHHELSFLSSNQAKAKATSSSSSLSETTEG